MPRVPKVLTLKEVAAMIGVEEVTARNYHHEASRRRREGGKMTAADFPPPDDRVGRVPVWLPRTITDWAANRPGQGANTRAPAPRVPRRRAAAVTEADTD